MCIKKNTIFKHLTLLVCFLIGILLAPSPAHAKETITWVVHDFIPFYIKEGKYKDKGIADKLINFFSQNLPQYDHTRAEMNFPRFFAQAEKGDLVCNAMLLKTPERTQVLAFSRPLKPAYTHVMVSHHPMDFPSEGISFEDFLKNDDHVIIVQPKRSYGPELDKIIEAAIDSNRILVQNFSTEQLFQMLLSGRIGHFLDVENSVTYYNKVNEGSAKTYNIPLREDRLDRFGYAACSHTPLGQAVINDINDVINRKAESREFRDILESWMATENLIRFREFYYREVLKK